jgi:Mrp family chromosome partitioning ATPase/capsular polysaccharide biosynthesis protein
MAADVRHASTLHDYLRILRRRKWIIVPAIVIAPLVAVLLSRGQAVSYQATAQVLVNRQNLAANIAGVNDPTQLDSTRLLATQAQFARLPVIARRTLTAAGEKNASASALLGESTVTASSGTDFLTFTVSDRRSRRAARLATAYARQYVLYSRKFQRVQLEAARQSVNDRVDRLARSGGTLSPLYATLVDRANQLAAMEAVAASARVLVRPATGAGRVSTNVTRNGILALIVGAILGIGMAFLADALDQRSRSADDIGGRLDLRLLGRLPTPPRALRRANRIVMLAAPESPYAESFRMLRTSLEFAMGSRGARPGGDSPSSTSSRARRGRRVLIASAVEGEGKSTTAANLAVAFASAGRRVVLVDLDFRRPSLHRFFNISAQPGLTDAVRGTVPLANVVSRIEDAPTETLLLSPMGNPRAGTLDVVPLGTLPPHGGDIAFAAGVDDVLRQFAAEADIVLIDAPPLLRVGDALALTSYVDDVLVVASLRALKPSMLDELRRVLSESPAAKLGFVLTGADSEGGYGYLTYKYGRVVNAG